MEIDDGGNVCRAIPCSLFILSVEYRVLIDARIPVYILNALYLAHHMHHGGHQHGGNSEAHRELEMENEGGSDANAITGAQSHPNSKASLHHNYQDQPLGKGKIKDDGAQQGHEMSGHEHHQHMSAERPMFATVTVGVCHCGAGCLLGDIAGGWLVYGTGTQIRDHTLWAEFLIGMKFN